MKRLSVLTALFALLLMILALPVFAQDAVAEGLTNPRGIAFDSEGNLYVVEAGDGGALTAEGPFGPTDAGGTGAVKMFDAEGDETVLIQNLGSMTAGNSRGAQDIIVTDESIWLLIGEAPESFPFTNALVELDREHFRVKTYVDLFTSEAELNPDADIISSNPTSFDVTDDGTVVIANAGCNCLQTWNPDDGVQIAASWDIDDNPVPTAVAVGPNGDIYVGFLTGFPFPAEGARIERWSGGELVQTYEGMTAVVDLLITDEGTIYAVEFGVFGDQGWGPGRVVMVDDMGITPVLEDLTTPWGLAMNGDGELFVSVGSAGGGTAGQVIAVPMN